MAQYSVPHGFLMPSCNGRVYYYKWDVGLSGWGLGSGDAGAICAVFIERDGQMGLVVNLTGLVRAVHSGS